jgi:DNA-binding IclR family transcriptional regulator
VLDAIRQRPRTLDELGRELGLDQAALAACVATLELDEVVDTDNGRYRPLI